MTARAEPRSLFLHVVLRVVPVAAIVLSLIGLSAAHVLKQADEQEVLGWLERESLHVVNLVVQPIRTVVNEAQSLARNDLIVNGLIDTEERKSYLPPFFRSLRLPGPDAAAAEVALLDYRGRIIIANRTEPMEGPTEAWRNAIAAGLVQTEVSSRGFSVVAPIRYLGLPEGAILIRYGAAQLPRLFEVGSVPLAIALLDAEDRIIFTSHSGLGTVGKLAGRLDPDDWLAVEQPLPGFRRLTLIVAQPTGEAFGTVHEVRLILLGTLLLSILAVIATAAVAALLATREVGRLVRLIRGIDSADDMDRRLTVQGPRELRDLGHSFNAMLNVLQEETTSRHYVDSILDSLAEILIVATPDGRIRTANPAACRFLADLGVGVDRPVAEAFAADSFESGADVSGFLGRSGGTAHLEANYVKPSGERITILWLKSVLREQGSGLAAGMVFVGQDITERIRVERLKSEFISTVSHELRTPLTSIAGTLGLLKGGIAGEVSEKARELIAIGHNNCNRLINLINDLLDIQKIEGEGMEFRMEPVALESIVEAAVARNGTYAAGRDVSFTFRSQAGGATVVADADRLDQVMANLLSNAAKFSPAGGTVGITLGTDGSEAIVAVADHGPGIPYAFRPRIFERFAQADSSDTRRRGGTGLGLAIVRAIVERHDGRVWYESAPGEGATFYFALPLHHEQPVAPAPLA